MGKILEGNYKNKNAIIRRERNKLFLMYSGGLFKLEKLELDNKSVSRVSILDLDEQKSLISTVGRGAVGGLLLGPVGLVGGALTGKKKGKYLIKIKFADGKESIAEVDKKTFRQMNISLNVE